MSGSEDFRLEADENCVDQVNVTQSTEAHKTPQIINTLQTGDYFGEKALIR